MIHDYIFLVLCDEIDNRQKLFLLYIKTKVKVFVLLSCKLKYILFSWNIIFFPERTSEKPWLFRLGYLTDMFLQRNHMIMSFQGKQLTVIAAHDKIWASKQKLKFRETSSATVCLIPSQYLKTYLMRLVEILKNVIL